MGNRNYSKVHHEEDRYYLGYKEGYREGYQDGYQDGLKHSRNIKHDHEKDDNKHCEYKEQNKYQENDTNNDQDKEKLHTTKASEDFISEYIDENCEIENKGKVRVELRIVRNDDNNMKEQEDFDDEKVEYRRDRKKVYEEDNIEYRKDRMKNIHKDEKNDYEKPHRYSAFDHFFNDRKDTRESNRRKSY
ncbi:hypothetical protein [Bacillus marasmi]|uniref:hypothetical protein n=1 Tax=Bacillus marasmi TaxID=1926279 RepID=UPI0011CB8FE7|nr:hypothetical protein [Bacillus marasmi]